MLSRVADSIYWMSRYVERAENVARFIDVNLQLVLDAHMEEEHQWKPLVSATGDHEDFTDRYGEATHDNVLRFLTFDRCNPNSILSCLETARENARSVREVISSAMWLELNKFYLMVKTCAAAPPNPDLATEFFNEVKLCSHLFTGITDATMTHGTGWHFSQIGRMLERADKASRILDAKHHVLLCSAEDAGTPTEQILWAAVLRSASAFEMYCKRYSQISPRWVVEFLMLDRQFPRSVQFCLLSARDSLYLISGTPSGTFQYPPEKFLGQLCSDLAFVTVDDVVRFGLHEYIDQFQTKLNRVGQAIADRFFALDLPPSTTPKPTVKLTSNL